MDKKRLQQLAGITVQLDEQDEQDSGRKSRRMNAQVVFRALDRIYDMMEDADQQLSGALGSRLADLGYKEEKGSEIEQMKTGVRMVLAAMEDMLPGLEMESRGEV